jgi:hypothetical protein
MDNTSSELVGRSMHCMGFEVSDLPDNNCLARICVESSWTVKLHTFGSRCKPCLICCSPDSWKKGSPLSVFSVLNLRLYQLQVAFQIILRVDRFAGMLRTVCRIARLSTRKKSKLNPNNGSLVHNISNRVPFPVHRGYSSWLPDTLVSSWT